MSSGVDPRRFADSYTPNFGLDWVAPRPAPSPAELATMTTEQLTALWKAKELRSKVEGWVADNPVGNGWVLPGWRMVMKNWHKYKVHVILGGNRSSKSVFASRLCVWGLGNIPEAEIRCYDVNGDYSKERQQALIWDALPRSLKSLPTKRGINHAVRYNQGAGFTNDQLIVPPLKGWSKGGQIDFTNYRSFEADSRTAEGWKAHIIWCDEALPVKLFETLQYRINDYSGRLILTFTTLDGWTPLVQDILGSTKTVEWRHSDLLNRKLPIMQESMSREKMAIYYFWTQDNPFVSWDGVRDTLRGRPEDEILCRAYGIPTKGATAVFTTFDRSVNVVKHENLPWIKNPNYPVTRYMAIDPAGAKNWFMLWVAVDEAGTWWVYREWPDHSTYGNWAEPGATIEGKPGIAQRSLGFGIRDYVDLIKTLEKGEAIFERIIDPRMGAAERQSSEEGATTIISDLDKHDIVTIPAPGVDIENGIQLIKNLLAYNQNKDCDAINSPRYYVSDACENHIRAMLEYTAKGGPNEASKDAVDPARYLAVSNIMYVSPVDMQTQGTTESY